MTSKQRRRDADPAVASAETVASPPADAPADDRRLGARVEPQADGGWLITIPVRAERVQTERLTVVREEVVLRPRMVSGVERVEGTVAREELRVEVEGDVRGDLEATQPIVDR
jgi:stress response protein YsnF